MARQRFVKVLRGIVKLQSLVRRAAAKKELKRLKVAGDGLDWGVLNVFGEGSNNDGWAYEWVWLSLDGWWAALGGD